MRKVFPGAAHRSALCRNPSACIVGCAQGLELRVIWSLAALAVLLDVLDGDRILKLLLRALCTQSPKLPGAPHRTSDIVFCSISGGVITPKKPLQALRFVRASNLHLAPLAASGSDRSR